MEEPKSAQRLLGLWHLASDPSTEVAGYLERDGEGRQELHLAGVLGLQKAGADPVPFPPPTITGEHRILGKVANQLLTLENCQLRKFTLVSLSPEQRWYVGESVIGESLAADEPFEFYAATFRLPGLTFWARPRLGELNLSTQRPITFGASVTEEALPLWKVGDMKVELSRCISYSERGETEISLGA